MALMDDGRHVERGHDGAGIGGDHGERRIAFDGGDKIDGKAGRGSGKRDGDGIVQPRIAIDDD
jgi:hypothetical protein